MSEIGRVILRRRTRPVIDRLWDSCFPEPNSGCWLWIGKLNSRGYGRLGVQNLQPLAHRLSYEAHVGPIPPGLDIDHLCRTRACINPVHLEPVTHRVNLLRGNSPAGIQARKTQCDSGHPFSDLNTITSVHADGSVHRRCRECRRVKHAAYKRRRRMREAAS